MIADERIVAYIHSLARDDHPLLMEIEKEARENYVPIVKKETKELLKVLVLMKQPKKILEVGTAVGFSSLYMNQYQPEGGTITTIERNEKRIAKAKENIKRLGKEEVIKLLEGEAMDILKGLHKMYDMIFVDASKGQYIHFLDEILRLLPIGGVLVSDNVLQEGDIVKSRYAIERRNRTIHKRMREYLYQITHMEEFETVVLPVGDGVTISIKVK
ncbi:MAG: O-methyltransferase [Lachnospiraceae bacterium]|nr:O-methyltransferase [Lachnospiraceae bacterium]